MKQIYQSQVNGDFGVVPYIGTWIETARRVRETDAKVVVPYIGTWIETITLVISLYTLKVVPYIGTWIETKREKWAEAYAQSYLI